MRPPTWKNRWFSPPLVDARRPRPRPAGAPAPPASSSAGSPCISSALRPRRRSSRARCTSARRWPSVATSEQSVGLQHEERAVQEVAGVLARDGELRAWPSSPQDGRAGSVSARACPPSRGSVGKSSARQRLHPRIEAIGGNFDAALVLLDPDVGLGQRLDDLVELLRRQRQRCRPSPPTPRSGCAARPRGRSPGTGPRSPSASISTLARIGIVFLRSTIPWKSCSSRRRSFLRTTSSMAVLTSSEGRVSCLAIPLEERI